MSAMRRFDIPTRSPRDLWREIESEAGPLHQIDIDGLKRALELAAVEALIRGESVVQVPRQIAERMLADLRAQQRSQSLRPKHRPRKNWWLRRWDQTAVAQFDRRMEQSREQPLVFGISLHTFVAGQPFRLRQIEQAIKHVTSHPEFSKQVWVTVPGEIARYAASLAPGIIPGSA
jgi:hypothetical protein